MKPLEQQIVTSIVSFIGMTVMTSAAFVSLLEVHQLPMSKSSMHIEAAPAHGEPKNEADSRMKERLRREKEKTLHEDVSYSVSMRSHPTAGPA